MVINKKSKSRYVKQHNQSKKTLSIKRKQNQYIGAGNSSEQSEAITDADKKVEQQLLEMLQEASSNSVNYVNNTAGYKQYWLESVIPSIIQYLDSQKDITDIFYKSSKDVIHELELSIQQDLN